MIFDKTLKNTTFVEFNPFIRYTDWDKIATMAENYFLKFINEKDYGENVISTRFVFLVEKEIDINNQDDVISTSTYLGISKVARLTVHLDFAYFANASEKRQYQIVVNGILFLLNYWKNNLKISKDTPLEEINHPRHEWRGIEDFTLTSLRSGGTNPPLPPVSRPKGRGIKPEWDSRL